MTQSCAQLNALSVEEFTRRLGGVYEDSPWVASAVAHQRPFADGETLRAAMVDVVDSAPAEVRLALIRAHPDLAGRLAELGQLSAESAKEQTAAGLTSLLPEQRDRLNRINAAYRAKFGFPLIICARRHHAGSILTQAALRLDQEADQEVKAALAEIHEIARLRLEDLLCTEN